MSFLTVKTIFSEYDQMKTGFVTFADFSLALDIKLQIKNLTTLDMQVLGKRYQSRTPSGEELIQYDRFFTDYQRYELKGIGAGYDPLKEQGPQRAANAASSLTSRPLEQSADSKALYAKLGTYCQKNSFVDRICEALTGKDVQAGSRGCLAFQHIREVFQAFQMTLNTKQMNDLLQPVPTDPLDGAYYYLIVIELAFGRMKAQQVQAKQKGSAGGDTLRRDPNHPVKAIAVMTQRFKDQIEVKLSHLQAVIHQLTKGSYLLTEAEFTRVFRQAGITLTSADHEVL